jgi:hypothetical protein
MGNVMINFFKLFCKHKYNRNGADYIYDKTVNRWLYVFCVKCGKPKNKFAINKCRNLNYLLCLKEEENKRNNEIVAFRRDEINRNRFFFRLNLIKKGFENKKIKEIMEEYDYHENIKERNYLKNVYNIDIGV